MTLRCTICCCTGFAILSGDYTVTAWRSIILFTWFKPCNNIGWFRYCRTWQKCKKLQKMEYLFWYTQLRIFYIEKSHHFYESVLLITLETAAVFTGWMPYLSPNQVLLGWHKIQSDHSPGKVRIAQWSRKMEKRQRKPRPVFADPQNTE